jgi:hypothetical protein
MCAAEQGKFWEYHKLLFEKAPQIDVAQLAPYAEQVGLDKAKFEACLSSHSTEAIVVADIDEGKKAGVSGTPAFFVNGVPLAGGRSLNEFAKAIDAELARLKLEVPPPPPPPAPAARMQPPGRPGQPQIVTPNAAGAAPPAPAPSAPNAAVPAAPPPALEMAPAPAPEAPKP